jgi:hypothetical protein
MSWLILIAILPAIFYTASTYDRMKRVEKKLDEVLGNLEGLRQYLYEIDPQFEDERQSNKQLEDEHNLFAPMNDMELLERKRAEGRRTLDTPFRE